MTRVRITKVLTLCYLIHMITSFGKSPGPPATASTYHIMTPPLIPRSHVKLPPPHLSSRTLLRNHTNQTPFHPSFAVQSLSRGVKWVVFNTAYINHKNYLLVFWD